MVKIKISVFMLLADDYKLSLSDLLYVIITKIKIQATKASVRLLPGDSYKVLLPFSVLATICLRS